MTLRSFSVITLALVLALSVCAFGQTSPSDANLAAIGISYQPGGSPAIAGTGLYARQVSGSTYAFTALDAIPEAGVKPFTVDTGVAMGVAQRVLAINGVEFYVPLAAGFSYTGNNVGWTWNTGGLAVVKIKNSSWRVLPNLRVIKSSVGSKQGYNLIGGILFGWGWN